MFPVLREVGELLGRMGGFAAIISLFVLAVATLTTNLAANVVAPANGFSNIAPEKMPASVPST